MKDVDSEIESYSKYVKRLAESKSDVLISNGMLEHARILVCNLLLHAEEKIRIFSSNLAPRIYDDDSTIEALHSFLSKKGTTLEILLQDGESFKSVERLEERRFLKTCRDANLENESVVRCEIKLVASESDSEIKQHFVIMDSQGYRFCPDKDIPIAIAQFNCPTTASNLIKQFNTLFARSILLTVHQPV